VGECRLVAAIEYFGPARVGERSPAAPIEYFGPDHVGERRLIAALEYFGPAHVVGEETTSCREDRLPIASWNVEGFWSECSCT
jgi:hypothetical protein